VQGAGPEQENVLSEDRQDRRHWKLFAALAVLGVVAGLVHVKIPHTAAIIDGRWAFGFMGFVLLPWGRAALLAAALSFPFGSDISIWVGVVGNLLYAVPCLLVFRALSPRLLARWGPGWIYGLGWAMTVLLCYQAFIVPAVWTVLALLEGTPVWANVVEGWRTQPLLTESVLVALFSATAMVAVLIHGRLRLNQHRLDHLYRVLLALKNVKRLVVREEDDPRRLIEQACAGLAETAGYPNAWIALLDADGETVSTAAASGPMDGFDALRQDLAHGDFPGCMRQALQNGGTVVVEEPAARCLHCPLSAKSVGRAGLSRRLAFDGRTYGVLTVSVPTAYARDPEEQGLFGELADDLAFALHRIEMAERMSRGEESLQEGEQFLRTLLETTVDGFWVVDTGGFVTEVNTAICAMTGYAREELLGLRINDVDAVESPAKTEERTRRIIRNGSEIFETRLRRKDGRLVPVEISTTYLPSNGGRFVCFCRDLTERERREERIALLGGMLDAAPVSAMIVDTGGRILYVNREAVAMHGYDSEEEFRALSLHDLDAPESRALIAERMKQVRERGEAHFEVAHYRKDGTAFSLEAIAKAIEWDGRPAVLSLATDITERKQAENRLREQNRFITAVMDHLPIGLAVSHYQEETAKYINKAFEDIYGWPAEEIHRVSDFFSKVYPDPEYREEIESRIRRDLESGDPERMRWEGIEVVRKDGSKGIVSARSMLLAEQDLVISTVQDETRRTLAERELRLSETRLRRAQEVAHIGDWEIDMTRGTVAASQEAGRIYGLDLEGLTMPKIQAVPLPEYRPMLDKALRDLVEEGARYDVELRIRRASDNALVDIHSVAEYDSERNVVFGVVQDVTERKRQEEALRESERRWRSILVNTPQIGVALDPRARIVFANKHFLELTGWREEEVFGGDWFDLFIPEDVRERVRGVFDRVMATGSTAGLTNYENEITTRSGERRLVAWSNVVTQDAGGAVADVTCLGIDLTERKRAEERDRYQMGFISSLLNSIPDIVFYKDMDGVYLGCNEEFARHVGWPREEIVGKTDYDLYTREEADEFRVNDRLMLESGGPRHNEEWISYPDGRRVLLDTLKTVLRDSDGNWIGTLGISRDITDRKRAEEALRESEERVRRKLRALLDPEEDFYELSLADMIDTETIQKLMDDLHRLTGVGVGLMDRNGEFLASTGWQDVCANFHRVHPETRRFCEESDTALAADVEPGVFHGYKCKNHMRDVSTPVVIGGEHVGNLFLGQFFYEDEEPDRELFRARARKYGFDEKEYLDALGRVRRYSRETVECAMGFYSRFAEFVSTLSYGNLKLARILEERTRMEEEREKLREQLTQAQKMESVGRLAGGVAHDFNNMLNVIMGYSDMMMHDLSEDSPLRNGLEEIRKAACRSADLTRQLLAFARKQTVAPKVLDLNETVGSMLKMLGRLIGEDIELAWKPAEDLDPVRMDPSQIDQLLANLCVNARDAIGHATGTLTIETGRASLDEGYCAVHADFVPGDYVLLVVSDDGCGMDKETLAKIFEPFFTTKGLGQGTGLGLATVFGVVRQNNGFVNVYSEPGKGTTFKIYLPAYKEGREGNEGREGPVCEQAMAEPAAKGGEAVLVVEDEPATLDMAKLMLERLGYAVLTAPNPDEAVRLAESLSAPIHLLVTDVVMPGMNGRELADRLVALHPDLKCLFMSGYTADVIARQGVLDQGVSFIQKPFSLRELGVKVREVLEGNP